MAIVLIASRLVVVPRACWMFWAIFPMPSERICIVSTSFCWASRISSGTLIPLAFFSWVLAVAPTSRISL